MNVVLIPALNPNEKLVEYVSDLKEKGFREILIVNDGSNDCANEIFDRVLQLNGEQFGVTLFEHAINLGKGRALKNGINYYLTHLKDKYKGSKGVITVDSDGQHLVKDVEQISRLLSDNINDGIILGCRNFDQENVPFKSRFGNKLTKWIFKFLFGKTITDTQTGLRAFSNKSLKLLLDLFGERFEYETNVLIECVDKRIPIYEMAIETVYEEGNKSTHFNPILDSIKIYRLLFARFCKYLVSSFSSSLIDLVLFALICSVIPVENTLRIYFATIGARVVSSLFNYEVNKNIVFKYKKEISRTAIQYFSLCVWTMIASGFLVNRFYTIWGQHEFFIKCVVDMVLFCCNYFIQQKVIFKDKEIKN